jgi:hypothetical protein
VNSGHGHPIRRSVSRARHAQTLVTRRLSSRADSRHAQKETCIEM